MVYARIDDGLEKEFRLKVVEKYGGKQGALKIAVEEAIKLWVEKE